MGGKGTRRSPGVGVRGGAAISEMWNLREGTAPFTDLVIRRLSKDVMYVIET